MSDPSQWGTIPEIVRAAQKRLSPQVWDYSAGGAETEATLRRNRTAFQQVAFRPRVLRDVSTRDTSTSFLGIPLTLPVMLAPVGSITQFDPEGALASACAAHEFGTAAVVGSLSNPSLERVAEGSDGPTFFQLYLNNRTETENLVRRAEDAGYQGLCLTVDSAAYGRRDRDIANRFKPRERDKPNAPDVALRDRPSGESFRDAATWTDFDWLRSLTNLPLMVKGIIDANDARLAVEHGADVVYVSNHGGRQLDHLPATIEVLPEMVDAVGGRADVLVDSGFTRGTDVLKAVAMGARAVLIGKLLAWGLAAGGVPGLVRVLELLRLEMYTAMASVGVSSVAELTTDHVRAVAPPLPPGELPWA